jgi:uncharacterized protein
VKLAVRVRPGACADRVGGCWDGPRGRALLVAVRARAVDGKANEAVVAALAEALGIRRSAVTITAGHRSRDKTVELVGDDGALRALTDELAER